MNLLAKLLVKLTMMDFYDLRLSQYFMVLVLSFFTYLLLSFVKCLAFWDLEFRF
jgi:hypothetical protein